MNSRNRDEAARDRDDAARDKDDAARALVVSDREAAVLLRKWSTTATVILCLVLSVLWFAIVFRQNYILNELGGLKTTLEHRTGRFERLEKMEIEQSEVLKRLLADREAGEK